MALHLIFLAGCSSHDAGTQPVQNSTSTVLDLTGAPLPATETRAPELVGPSDHENSPPVVRTEEQAGQTESASAPTPRQSLEATDPSTVKLASGKVQLVEFFAFW